MQKLFLFLILTILFTSCSNDELAPIVENEKKQTVTFKVKSDLFTIESSPLKSFNPTNGLCQYIVYKETGEVYFEKTLLREDIRDAVDANGMLPITLELANGKYNIAILSAHYSPMHPIYYKIKPNNYETDYYSNLSPTNPHTDNAGVYYETFGITIAENKQNTVPESVELKPMWCAISIVIEDAQTLEVPEETEDLDFRLDPIYFGFSIKTKLAKKLSYAPTHQNLVQISDLRKNPTYTLNVLSAQSGEDLTINVNCLRHAGEIIIATKSLVTTKTLENAKKYEITGKLVSIKEPKSSHAISISLGEFDNENNVIPFD